MFENPTLCLSDFLFHLECLFCFDILEQKAGIILQAGHTLRCGIGIIKPN